LRHFPPPPPGTWISTLLTLTITRDWKAFDNIECSSIKNLHCISYIYGNLWIVPAAVLGPNIVFAAVLGPNIVFAAVLGPNIVFAFLSKYLQKKDLKHDF